MAVCLARVLMGVASYLKSTYSARLLSDLFQMKVCTPLVDFRLDDRTKSEIAKIAEMRELKVILPTLLAGSQFVALFFKSNTPQAAYNLSQADWNTWALAMKASDSVVTTAIRKRAEANWTYYQFYHDHKHLIFWRNFLESCG